jgi:hypothetical protein
MTRSLPQATNGLERMYRHARAWVGQEIARRPRLLRLRLYLRFRRTTKRRLERQLVLRQPAELPAGQPRPRIFVALVESAHYQHFQLLILAKALQLRGADVTVLFCGSALDGCEVKSVRNVSADPCITCRFNERHIASLFDVNIVHIADFFTGQELATIRREVEGIAAAWPAEHRHEGIDIMPMTRDSVTRYFYGAMPDSEAELQRVRLNHLSAARTGVELARRIEERYAPDVVLSHMFVYTDWEPYYRYFQAPERARFISLSMSPLNYRALVLNEFEFYSASKPRFQRFLELRAARPLDEAERGQLSAFMNERVSGTARIFQDLQFFERDQQIVEMIGLDTSKRNIFLFSNVYWDVGMSDFGSLFTSVVDWVLDTIGMVAGLEDCHLYIKPHPAEVFDTTPSAKGIVDFIRERYETLPGNVSIIDPALKIPTYELFPFIDVGVVYNGTLGLEMLLHDVPVVVVGKAPYGDLGFAAEPRTMAEYAAALVSRDALPVPERASVELFAYFYFIKRHIPWRLTDSAYAHNFRGYTFESLDALLPGRDPYLDHLCNCVLDPATVIEAWREDPEQVPDSVVATAMP